MKALRGRRQATNGVVRPRTPPTGTPKLPFPGEGPARSPPPGARRRTPENWGLSAGERPLLAGQSGGHRRPSPPASDTIASPGDGPFTRWPRRVVRPIRHRRAAKHDPSAARLACDKSGPVRRLRCTERRPSSGGTACAAGVARAPSANGPASYSAACSHRRPCQWTNGPMRPHARALVMAGRERDRRRSSSRPLRSAARSAAPGARAVTGSCRPAMRATVGGHRQPCGQRRRHGGGPAVGSRPEPVEPRPLRRRPRQARRS